MLAPKHNTISLPVRAPKCLPLGLAGVCPHSTACRECLHECKGVLAPKHKTTNSPVRAPKCLPLGPADKCPPLRSSAASAAAAADAAAAVSVAVTSKALEWWLEGSWGAAPSSSSKPASCVYVYVHISYACVYVCVYVCVCYCVSVCVCVWCAYFLHVCACVCVCVCVHFVVWMKCVRACVFSNRVLKPAPTSRWQRPCTKGMIMNT